MKEWKYRFKRGLASILTVGMIASGVNAATCLPVYAEETMKAATNTNAYTDAELKAAIQQVSAGLKGQILELFNEEKKPTGKEEAEFKVTINFEEENITAEKKEAKYAALNEAIKNNVPKILSDLLAECPSELFWYDQASNLPNSDCSYSCVSIYSTANRVMDFTFKFAVKEYYRYYTTPVSSIWVQKIRDRKSALEDPELKNAGEQVYAGLKEEISKLFSEDRKPNLSNDKAEFIVSFDVENQEKYKVLKEEVEKNVSDIVSRLLNECSSELFWYDQSTKSFNDGSSSYSWIDNYSSDNKIVDFIFKFEVKKDYRFYQNLGYETSINIQKIRDEKQAVDEIFNIEEGCSDYEILCRYRDAIEKGELGYLKNMDKSEAFQYLCDNTKFSGTKCDLVEGKRDGEECTWNIVTMERGSYLVDFDKGYFLVGVIGTEESYKSAFGGEYIPNEKKGEYYFTGVGYKKEQTDFHFVEPYSAWMEVTGKVGDVITVEVDGNVDSYVFFWSEKPDIAEIVTIPGHSKLVNVKLKQKGRTWIFAGSRETDAYSYAAIRFTLTVEDDSSEAPVIINPNNPGSGNNGGNSNGGGGAIGGGGGSIGGGSTVTSGGLGGNTTRMVELIPQTDFRFDVGYTGVVKTVGAADFKYEASGQVAGSNVTYESSDTSVATVDANSGQVHIVGPGNAKIIATASETDIHKSATCEYKLEVVL